jgi:hypothetical protein
MLTEPSLHVELVNVPIQPMIDNITMASPLNIIIQPTLIKFSVSMYKVGSYILGSILNQSPIPINVIPEHWAVNQINQDKID